MFQKGHAIIKTHYKENHLLNAHSHTALAKVYLRTTQLDSVLKHFKHGINVLKAHEMEQTHLAGSLYLIKSDVYVHQNNFQYSLRLWQKARQIFHKTVSDKDNRKFQVQLSIARCYKNTGDYEQGLYHAKEAHQLIKIQPPHAKRVNFNKARVNQVLTTLYMKTGQLSKSEASIQRAIELYEQILPPGHLNFASAYSQYYKVALTSNKLDTALNALNKIKPILKQTLGPHSSGYVKYSYTNVGKIFLKKGNY